MTTLLVVLLIGATLRLTRLLTSDAILEPLRSRFTGRIGYMVRCDWCMSWWVGLVVFLVGWNAPDPAVWIVSGALTASHVAGLLALIEVWIDAIVWGSGGDD